MVTRAQLAVVVALGLLLPPGASLADAPVKSRAVEQGKKKHRKKSASRKRARAQAAFEKGKALFEADEFEGALVYFKRAYELSNRRPSTIIALAQCERILKRYDDALIHLREYLATSLPEAEAIKVRETIQVVEELDAIEEREAAAAPAAIAETATAAVPPPPAAPAAQIALVPPPPLEEEEGGLLEDPIFWIVVGSVLVAGGAAAGIAVGVSDKDAYGGTREIVAQPDLR